MANGIGSMRIFAGPFPLPGYLLCDGHQHAIKDYPALFGVIGARYGGDGVTTFATPDFTGRIPIHVGSGPGLSPRTIGQTGGAEQASISVAQMAAHGHAISGGEAPATDRAPTSTSGLAESQGRIYAQAGTSPVAMSPLSVSNTGGTAPHSNLQPFLSLNFCIAYATDPDYGWFEPYAGEVRLFAGSAIPRNWLVCDGQIRSMAPELWMFSLLGTLYGGDGRTTYALPDLRGRAPLGPTDFDSVAQHYIGDTGGSQTVTLTTDNLPAHAHGVSASSAVALSNDPAGKTLAVPFSGDNLYAPSAGPQTGLTGAIGSAGGGQPHNNMQPYLAVNYIICMAGIFPTRD